MIRRYLSIYKPLALEFQKSDNEVIKIARVVVTILVLMPYLYEHLVIKDFDKYTVYILLSKKQSSATDKGLPITAVLEACLAIFLVFWLQIKIENDRIKFNEKAPFWTRLRNFLKNDDVENEEEEYSKNSTRVIAMASVGFFMLLIIAATRVNTVDPYSTQKLVLGFTIGIFNSSVAPLLFILNNKSIRKYFKRVGQRFADTIYSCNV